jgi:hypothetical protein
MAFFRDMRTSRTVKFLLVHALASIVAGDVMLSQNTHVHAPFFQPYFIAFLQTFFGSLAGAFLSLNQLIIGLFRGFSGANEIVLLSHPVSAAILAGALSIGGIILAVAGKQMYYSKMMYVLFLLASLLFMSCSFVFFIDMGNNTGAILSHPAFLQPEK